MLEKFKHWLVPEEKFLKTPVGIFLLGAFLGELSPDPSDAVHFWLVEHVFSNPAIPRGLLAVLQIFDWYFLSASYFLFLLVVAYLLHINKVSTVRKLTIFGGVVSIGLAIGIIGRFVFSA